MLMNQVLDSSNSLHDPEERSHPLKRSASVASLPTPPRTFHKRSRSRPRSAVSQHDSDDGGSASDLDGGFDRGYAGRVKRVKTIRDSKNASENDDPSDVESPDRKRRRTLGMLPGHDEDEDENVFWTGRGGSSQSKKQENKVVQMDKAEDSSPSPAMLRYRVKAPVSPPPSRRQPSIQPTRARSMDPDASLTRPVAPVTPPRRRLLRAPSPDTAETFKTPTKSKATEIWPERDSPNNPFLIEPSDKDQLPSEWNSDNEEVGEALPRQGTPTPSYEEKPTITYVFRGQKATFHNPLYGLAPEVVAASKLPIDHPDYEAAEACPPKKLFSTGKRNRDRSRESDSTEGIKRPKVRRSQDDHDETSKGKSNSSVTESRKKISHAADSAATGDHQSQSQLVREAPARSVNSTREERERRETAAKTRLASRDGLRAGAVLVERDEPARRAMGPLRSA